MWTFESNTEKTAITRRAPSAPARQLNKMGLLKGKMLDYGCGKGFDAEFYGMDKYDCYFEPEKPDEAYDTIIAVYVLNTIFPEEVETIVRDIQGFLKDEGIAYLAVRRDIKREGFTQRRTYQWTVVLNLPVVYENTRFCIYQLRKGDIL